jgi:hypothetical protein
VTLKPPVLAAIKDASPMPTNCGTAEVQLLGNDREETQLIQLEHRCKT